MERIAKPNNYSQKKSGSTRSIIPLALLFLSFKSYAGITEGYALVLPTTKERTHEKHIYLFGETHNIGSRPQPYNSDEGPYPAEIQNTQFLEVLEETTDLRSGTSPLPIFVEKPGAMCKKDSVLGLLDRTVSVEKQPHVIVENAEIRRMVSAADTIISAKQGYFNETWAEFKGDRPYLQITIQDIMQELEEQYERYCQFGKISEFNPEFNQHLEYIRENIDELYRDIILNTMQLNVLILCDTKDSAIFHKEKLAALFRKEIEFNTYVQTHLPSIQRYLSELLQYIAEKRTAILKSLKDLDKSILTTIEETSKLLEGKLKALSQVKDDTELSRHLDENLPTLLEALQKLHDSIDNLYKDLLNKTRTINIYQFAFDYYDYKNETNNLPPLNGLTESMCCPAHYSLDLSLYQKVLESDHTLLCIVAGAGHTRRLKSLFEALGASIATEYIHHHRTYSSQSGIDRLLTKEEILNIFREYSFLKSIQEKVRNIMHIGEKKQIKKITLLTISFLLCSLISRSKNQKKKIREPINENVTNNLATTPSRRN